ncbi:MAG: DUF2326 domain-containing protein [Nitrospirae bacterium]|nr:DUF2326 domain-containing protein [Nitrospirota bacterium]
MLELNINGRSYFIKRYFLKNEKVLFGTNLDDLEEYTKPELRKILANKLFPFQDDKVFFEGNRFRTLMNFFIKDDLEHQKRVEPLNFLSGSSKAREVAVYNFFLLGLPTKDIIRYDDIAKEYDDFSKTVNGLENKIKIDYGKSIEEFKSERIKIEQSISLLENSLKDYKFLDNYKNIEKQLIEMTQQINERLKEYHSLSRKLKKIKEAFQFNQDVDIKQIRKLYNEVHSTFGDLVSKTLEEITLFKKEILENRNKFLITKEAQLQKSIDDVLMEISNLEQSRSELYRKLKEKGALDSITNTYEQLTLEKTQLSGKTQILKQIDELQEMMGNLHVTISEVKRDILNDIKQYAKLINDLRALFLEILQNAIFLEEGDSGGYFDISPKPDTPRNQLPFKIEVEIPKADALGQSRLKIVAYDMMVFLNNIRTNRQVPQFLIHDGVYHGISLNSKIKSLNYIYHQHLAYPQFQYIVTFNEDEIYIPEEKRDLVGTLDFDLSNVIIAEFNDSQQGMIFKRDFK